MNSSAIDQENKTPLSQEEKSIINSYFQDCLKVILNSYKNNNGKLKVALMYILQNKINTGVLSAFEFIEFDMSQQHPEKFFREYGVWRSIQRIQAILNHPCPEYILDKKAQREGLRELIVEYVATTIANNLAKEDEKKPEKKDDKFFSLTSFRKAINSNRKIPDNAMLEIDAGYEELWTRQPIAWLAEQLEKGICPEGFQVKFYKSVSDEDFVKLAKALGSGNCPKNLTLTFEKCDISSGGILALAEALKTGRCPEGLSFNIVDDRLGFGYLASDNSYEKAIAIAEALRTDKCPSSLTLNFRLNEIGIAGQIAITNAIAEGHRPANFASNYLHLNIQSTTLYEAVGNALQSGNFPAKVPVFCNLDKNDSEALQFIIMGLQSKKCPSGLKVSIRDKWDGSNCNSLGDFLAKSLAEGIKNGKFPANLFLDIAYNGIGLEGAKAIAEALVSPNCPEKLTLCLSDEIGIEGAQVIKQALASGRCAPGLTIQNEPGYFSSEIKKILDEGKRAYARVAAEKIMILHQGKANLNSSSPFFSLPNEMITEIATKVEPYRSIDKLRHVLQSMNPEKDIEVLPLIAQLRSLGFLPRNMIDKINISNKLHCTRKTQLEFSDDVNFNDIKSIAFKLQETGLKCDAFESTHDPIKIKLDLDVQEIEIILMNCFPDDRRNKIVVSGNAERGKSTIKFYDDFPNEEITLFVKALSDQKFKCMLIPRLVTPAYIKIDLDSLSNWLHQKYFSTAKSENQFMKLFSQSQPDSKKAKQCDNENYSICKIG